MTVRARIDVDVVFHDSSESSLTVGSVAEHLAVSPSGAKAINGTVGTAAVAISGGLGTLSTLAIKNTGTTVLRVAGAIDVPAGRLAVIPTATPPTVASVGGNGAYSCVWVG